jgi:hypothetical protein
MHPYIDADACPRPIKDIIYRAAERRRLHTTFVANSPSSSHHQITSTSYKSKKASTSPTKKSWTSSNLEIWSSPPTSPWPQQWWRRRPTPSIPGEISTLKITSGRNITTEYLFLKRKRGKIIPICTETCKSSVKMQVITGFTLS